MSFVKGQTLNEYLNKNNIHNNNDVPKELKDKLYNLFFTLYENGINHLDHNGNNIIIQDDGSLKIIDFGLVELYDKPVPESKREYKMDVCPLETYSSCYDMYLDHKDVDDILSDRKKASLKAKEEYNKRLEERLKKFKR